MNAIRCPDCTAINRLTAQACHRCGLAFSHLPPTAYVSLPVEQTFEAQGAYRPPSISSDSEIGRKAFFWYRVYCGVLAAIYLLVAAGGIALAVYAPATREYRSEETFIMGIVYAVLGGVLLIVFAVALLLPRRPYNWVVGIVMMAIGMTSCCFAPFLIPLLIYWVKPETKAYFGRN